MKLRPVSVIAAALVPSGCHSEPAPAPPQTPTVTAPEAPATPARQLGIDMDFYSYPRINVAGPAQQDTICIKGLHANAVSVSFPFFSNPVGTAVTATQSTPTPTQLGIVITAAQHDGLTVTLRLLLDERVLGVSSRVDWEPVNLTAWFAAYQRFLQPYAALTQHDHVAVFIVGVEFTRFNAAPQWNTLDTALRAVYHGTLAYSRNWSAIEHPMTGKGGTGVTEMTDVYPPMPLPGGTPQAILNAAWDLWARPIPQGTVLSELGIAAQSGAYLHPYELRPASTPLLPQIQVNWFNAACHAVSADHLGGLCFWSLNFGQSLTTPAGPSDPGSFAATPGAAAIAKCFTTLGAA